MERRLVTILAIDAVDYSRLIGEDEEAALALFHARRAIVEDRIPAHRGRVFGGAGDSIVAEFTSPVEALRCAMEIQQKIAAENEPVPEDRRMHFRIGLNLGDAVVESGNLFGEAVNVAARLEGLSEAGGICISDGVYEQVKHLPDFTFRDLGARTLKNIPFTVRAYAVQNPGLPNQVRRRKQRPVPWIPLAAMAIVALVLGGIGWRFLPGLQAEKTATPLLASMPSVAILPLDNLSRDASQDYFSDGLTQDITTDLSKFSNLFVISSNSAFAFKGKPTKIQDIGTALGARYVLEGSVQRSNGKVRINAQLIDATTGNHVWAERYDGDASEVLAVQDEIAQKVVTALKVKVDQAELKRASQKETSNMDAYDKFLQARRIIYDPELFTQKGHSEAFRLLEESIKLDPKFPLSYGLISYLYVTEFQNGYSKDGQASLRKAVEVAKQELEISPDSYDGRYSLAIALWNLGQFDESFEQYEIARKLNPNDPDLAATMGEALVFGGEAERAVAVLQDAIKRSPVDTPYWYWWNLGRAYYSTGQYQEAIDTIGKITDPPSFALLITAASKARLNQADLAKKDMDEFKKKEPEWTLEKSAAYYYRNEADKEDWLKGLSMAGLK